LTRASFNLEGDPPTVTVEAGYSKRRRRDVLPLRADLVGRLCPFLSLFDCAAPSVPQNRRSAKVGFIKADEGDDDATAGRLWPGTWAERSAKMLHADLKAARMKWLGEAGDDAAERERRERSSWLDDVDDAGHMFDFHALRHQFISNLARGKVHPKEAQLLARHSTISLTMDRYTHLGIVDLTAALDALPMLPGEGPASEAAELRATGTDGPTTKKPNPVAPNVAPTHGIWCPPVSPSDHEGGEGGREEKPAKHGRNRDFRAEKSRVANGTRTHDPQIHNLVL